MFLLLILSFLSSGVLSSLPLQHEEFQFPSRREYSEFRLKHDDSNARAPLPTSINPSHYNLYIRPILPADDIPVEDQFTAPGSITITLNCTQTTSQVVFNKDPSLAINENSILLADLNGEEIKVSNISYDEPNALYQISFTSPLEASSQYQLSMEFVSQVNDGLSGLYRANYETPSGETKWMATTQLQSYGARIVFPCFDEPGLKATYNISIGRREEMNSLSNTDQILTGSTSALLPELPANWVWDVYRETPPMSSYLVAIIVSEFTCQSADPSIFPGREVRVCGPPHQILDQDGATYSVEAAAKIMQVLETTFKFPYEMPKLDNAAIPKAYFAPGGMENWGLVTYKDSRLLYFDGQTTEAELRGILTLEFHEMAHLWYGDLLTCASWPHVWLNEGFATYVSAMVQEVAPDFDSEREFLWERGQVALAYDIGLQEPILNVNDTSGYDIIYSKAGSVIRMMQGFLGKEVLLNALQEYVRRNAYKAVVQDQLFEVLTEFAGGKIPEELTMKDIMDTWTIQPGYPLLRVNQISSTTVNISQERYFHATSAGSSSENTQVEANDGWEIPIAIVSSANPDFNIHTPALWLHKDQVSTVVELDVSSWILLNPDAMAFVRVLYDDQLVDQIHAQLSTDLTKISGLSRSQLIDDYFSFAKLGHSTVEKALKFTTYLANDNDHIVWYTVLTNLDKVRVMFEDDSSFSDYLKPKVETVLETLLSDWSNESLPQVTGSKMIFTSKMLDWACALGSLDCQAFAVTQFSLWMNDENNLNKYIPVDMAPTLFCHAVANMGESAYTFLLNQYINADIYNLHKPRFVNALACANGNVLASFLNEKVLQLNGACTTSCLTKMDAINSLQKVTANEQGRILVVRAVQENLEKIKLDLGEDAVAAVATTLGTYFNTAAQLNELTAFVEILRPALPSQGATLNAALANVQLNINWMEETGGTMKQWFDQQNSKNQ